MPAPALTNAGCADGCLRAVGGVCARGRGACGRASCAPGGTHVRQGHRSSWPRRGSSKRPPQARAVPVRETRYCLNVPDTLRQLVGYHAARTFRSAQRGPRGRFVGDQTPSHASAAAAPDACVTKLHRCTVVALPGLAAVSAVAWRARVSGGVGRARDSPAASRCCAGTCALL